MRYKLLISDLSNSKDLWSEKVTPLVEEQLKSQGKTLPDTERYRIIATISQGLQKPADDVDNYVKPIVDSITYSKLVWIDDSQIDEMLIRRKNNQQNENSDVEIVIEKI